MDTVSPMFLILGVVLDNLLSRSTSDRRGRCVVSSSFSSTTLGLDTDCCVVGVPGSDIMPLITDRSLSDTAGEVTVGMYHWLLVECIDSLSN